MDAPPAFERVVVVCPKGVETGGPEALHQLVDSLRRQGVDAGIAPLPGTQDAAAVEAYRVYDAPEVAFEDAPGTAVVVPEAFVGTAASFTQAIPFVWWLSADHAAVFLADWQVRDPWRQVSETPLPMRSAEPIDLDLMARCRHLTQSSYAWSYLFIRLGIDASMLSDYTRVDRFPEPGAAARAPVVSYNDTKSGAIVRHLAKTLPKIEFAPIRDLCPAEVAELLGRSAIYLDLGFHPGKDRLPREAALAGALVVVARRGAGAYRDDVPIPERHKLRADDAMLVRAARVIPEFLGNLRGEVALQDSYRESIRGERQVFDNQVRAAFIDGVG